VGASATGQPRGDSAAVSHKVQDFTSGRLPLPAARILSGKTSIRFEPGALQSDPTQQVFYHSRWEYDPSPEEAKQYLLYLLCGGEKRTRREGRLTTGLAICSNPKSDMTDKFKLKVGEALPGFRFKPGECFVNSTWGEEFRQGKSTPKQFDGLTRERGERANAFLKILWKWLLSQDGNKEARGGGSSEGEADQ
jgi:hypothetical protein